ncbi:hypothetical protein Tco_0218745 [Tanacetum coccineum]
MEETLVQHDLNQVVEIQQVIGNEQMVLDMIVDEKLVLHMVDDEQLVHHNFIVVEEVNRIIVFEEMLKTVGYTVVGCTVECCKMELDQWVNGLGHEHKFITEIVARRENECIVSITEPDYKNLNKNDIEDMYLLIMNGKVPDYAESGLLWSLSVFIKSSVIWERVHDFQLGIESYQQKVNLTTPTISFPRIEKHKIVLEGLKSYNNDVKYGYVQRERTNDEVEYLKLFEEEIEVRLKYHNQLRRWELYVNGRPLGP